MKIIFNTKELIKKVKNIAPTAEAKQTLIILGNMVFQVKNNTAQMTASDLEIEVTSSIECSSDGDCQFSLPARKLLEILNALSVYEDIVFTLRMMERLILQQVKVRYHYLLCRQMTTHIWSQTKILNHTILLPQNCPTLSTKHHLPWHIKMLGIFLMDYS